MFQKKKGMHTRISIIFWDSYMQWYTELSLFTAKTLCAQVKETWVSFLSYYVWVIV